VALLREEAIDPRFAGWPDAGQQRAPAVLNALADTLEDAT
jgi:hypothetical protein